MVRGQYAGYRKEPGVARESDVEALCALRLFIASWRWQGRAVVPVSGKYLAASMANVMVELKPRPQKLFDDSVPMAGLANYLHLRLSPNLVVAPAARVERAGIESVGDLHEFYLRILVA
ncbi:hypothetical protein BI364_10460 [Acidihalobacter yilgarnensis]|uniref:Glucose-6-phosphate dehydrogenase C-terminal domain-containing protein n=1 Tax=Acidihalobacter yilgarnensis TaxID=2819280 RepID=A0A1D8IPG1_9GAMM|nr:hypothetical protein BI364_10460 [Acidihalobacter yilgarnensis]